jgi:hypothetical protein
MNTLTPHQERQMEWLRHMEAREVLGSGKWYEATCRDDNDSTWCHAADTLKIFIRRHAGHRTWIDVRR